MTARRLRIAVTLVALAAVVLWLGRRPLLGAVGRALVAEDPLVPVDAIVVSNAAARADALEAARLYRDGVSTRVVVPTWAPDPLDAELRCLGVPVLDVTALARAILDRSGVPPSAIATLPGAAAGTEDEIAAVADHVRMAGLRSLLYVAPRSHGARARWLLRRRVPAHVHVAVRGAVVDHFDPDRWWSSRDASREVMAEYLRWLNSALLGDAWRGRSVAAPVRCSCCDGGHPTP
jgi:uncharacterized SAM-binding protein YcdF (DUF218 family)